MTTSPLKVEGSRAQFEAWFKNEIIETPDFVFNDFDENDNEYIVGEDDNEELYLNIQAMFMAWTASRVAIVVDTGYLLGDGDNEDSDYTLGFNQGITKADKAIRAAGITVKGDS